MYLMLLQILSILLNILWWIIIVQAVMSWLLAFNVINTHNEFVRQLWYVLERITEPLYRPFRRIMPDFGGIDLTPMVVLILLIILRRPVMDYLYTLGVNAGVI
ncbi:YggT family protein [Sphingopyxis sp. NJF-3]